MQELTGTVEVKLETGEKLSVPFGNRSSVKQTFDDAIKRLKDLVKDPTKADKS